MKRNRLSEEKAICVPKEHETGAMAGGTCRLHGISSAAGDVGQIRTSLAKGRMAVLHAAQRPFHSTRAEARFL